MEFIENEGNFVFVLKNRRCQIVENPLHYRPLKGIKEVDHQGTRRKSEISGIHADDFSIGASPGPAIPPCILFGDAVKLDGELDANDLPERIACGNEEDKPLSGTDVDEGGRWVNGAQIIKYDVHAFWERWKILGAERFVIPHHFEIGERNFRACIDIVNEVVPSNTQLIEKVHGTCHLRLND